MSYTPCMRTILADWLTAHGYDGLFNADQECGCEVGDLVPCCGGPEANCTAGYKVPCDPDDCPADGLCDWHIAADKPAEELKP